ncbi:MAG: hypothetical protein HPY30_01945 [Gammaproteobacteria bacterium (ex Lamellibrachia satsuma)]|nr:MAG: hypothetical protein HPY30_01945 [Gammaproteobacteria bacterium (ex Lamellibrachia satsuma)]
MQSAHESWVCVKIDSVIYSNARHVYNSLLYTGSVNHLQVKHRREDDARGKTHINRIKSFWSFVKAKPTNFRGMNKHLFYLYSIEYEFCLNFR